MDLKNSVDKSYRPFFSGSTNVKFYWIQANDHVKSNSVKCHVLVACTYHPKLFRNLMDWYLSVRGSHALG